MKLKIFLTSTLIAFFSFTLPAQMYWYSTFDNAKKSAVKSGKLLLIDFWASWCQPCKKMDTDLWNPSVSSAFAKRMIAVKIDVDTETSTPSLYSVRGIPMVVIALADGTMLWKKIGFSSPSEYTNVFNSVPPDVSELYARLNALNDDKKNAELNLNVALEYQKIGKNIDYSPLKTIFISEDSRYFKKALKLTDDPKVKEQIELLMLFNDIYYGKSEKVLKNFSKDFGSADKCLNADLAHYILARSYHLANDTTNYQKEIGMVTNKEAFSFLD